jgi:hypothetical protein
MPTRNLNQADDPATAQPGVGGCEAEPMFGTDTRSRPSVV